MTVKNAFYAQSGGVTAVINASACGVLQAARQHPEEIGKVYAGRNGIIGALTVTASGLNSGRILAAWIAYRLPIELHTERALLPECRPAFFLSWSQTAARCSVPVDCVT